MTVRLPAIEPGQLRAAIAACGLGDAWVALLPLAPRGAPCVSEAGAPPYPASMIKTPLAVATAVAIEAGRLGWDEPLAIDAANMTLNDAPSPLHAGARATVRQLVGLMLERSDNVATNVLIDRVGRHQATSDLAALGFPQTAIRRKLSGSLPLIDDPAADGRNTHPPVDACALFAAVADGRIPGAAAIEASLARQYWNTKLSAGLAPGDRFAHKTGDTDEVSHDGGILDLASGERYALAVYTRLGSSPASDRRIAAFMRYLRPLLTVGPRTPRS